VIKSINPNEISVNTPTQVTVTGSNLPGNVAAHSGTGPQDLPPNVNIPGLNPQNAPPHNQVPAHGVTEGLSVVPGNAVALGVLKADPSNLILNVTASRAGEYQLVARTVKGTATASFKATDAAPTGELNRPPKINP
jgi:hypothetical protein